MQTVEMPSVGNSVIEGSILRWLKHVGDPVQAGESLLELETDKINCDFPSPVSGILRAILVPEDVTVPVGTPIALIGEADEPFPDPSILPQPPIVILPHAEDDGRKGRLSFLATVSMPGGIVALALFFLFRSQLGESGSVLVFIGFALLCVSYYLDSRAKRRRGKRKRWGV